MKINYVIAAWSGPRRDGSRGFAPLVKQIERLHLLRHDLTQITVVVSHDPAESAETRDYLKFLERSSLPIVVKRRENEGLSYGAWSYAYDLYRGAFDYYIFMEDDYYFVEDHFDKTLVGMLGRVGYLCGFVSDDGRDRWPGNAIGIASAATLESVKTKFGRLPYDTMASDGRYTHESGQIAWGRAFRECGFRLDDITDRYGCLHWYWQHGECRLVPGQRVGNRKFLYVPYQAAFNCHFLLYKDLHLAQEGILFATGPTLGRYDHLENDGSRVRVGVNAAIAENVYLDYYFCGHVDARSCGYLDRVKSFGGRKFGYTRVDDRADDRWLSDRQALDLGVAPYGLTTSMDFQTDIVENPVVDHAINFSALQFMIYAGIRRIYLVGCDATNIVSNRDDRIDEDRQIGNMMKAWRAFQGFADRVGVEIVSVNPVGLKGMFRERVSR